MNEMQKLAEEIEDARGLNVHGIRQFTFSQSQRDLIVAALRAQAQAGEPVDDQYSTAIVWSEEDHAYLASSPELPGCMSDGQSKAEALRELTDARAAWIGACLEAGNPVPLPNTLGSFAAPPAPSDAGMRERCALEAERLSEKPGWSPQYQGAARKIANMIRALPASGEADAVCTCNNDILDGQHHATCPAIQAVPQP